MTSGANKQQGWTGPKEVEGQIIEGSFHAHQVPLPKAQSDETQLKALDDWLSSYKISELLTDGKPTKTVLDILPYKDEKKLGQLKKTYDPYIGLKAVDWQQFGVEKGTDQSCMKITGKLLDKVFQENPTTIRLFSPDELESNKLDAVLDHTQRNFQWDQYSRGGGGRVIEVLSEHTCQGFMQGYTLTGRTAVFPSYESFLGIVHTMMVQYSKFVKIAREVKWRGDLPSINYIETSTWARQEHNGFSHQNPSFIGAVLNIKPEAARVSSLFPPFFSVRHPD
jgi:xylulose-5-phosphate/fructose-6-phosphate phosphoketolase